MARYGLARVSAEIAALPMPAENNTAKGRRIQDLSEYLLNRIPGVTVTDRNQVSASGAAEKDLWVENRQWRSQLLLDVYFPVECKNEASATSAPQVREFATKIKQSGGFDGLLVTAAGLSGQRGTHGHDAIHLALADQVRIVVITATDLLTVATTDDLVTLINERYREVRSKQDYVSI